MEYGVLPNADHQGWHSQTYWGKDEEQQEYLQDFVRKGWKALYHRVEEKDDIRVLREVSE